MANPYQIDSAFRDLGVLFAAEHSEGDDEGASQVQNLVKLLRKFKQHEIDEHKQDVSPVREASYTVPGGAVWYDAGDAVKDAADLYTVLSEQHKTGSPNLENLQARTLLTHLQAGGKLAEQQIGLLRGLMAKHQRDIDVLRCQPNHGGQDLMAVPTAGSETRIIKPNQEI
jgi:hypothetical protein